MDTDKHGFGLSVFICVRGWKSFCPTLTDGLRIMLELRAPFELAVGPFAESSDTRERRDDVRHHDCQSHAEQTGAADAAGEEGIAVIDGDQDATNNHGVFEGAFDYGRAQRKAEGFFHGRANFNRAGPRAASPIEFGVKLLPRE